MKISQLLTLFFGMLIIGCNETVEKKDSSPVKEHEVAGQQLTGWKKDITLNDGIKWEANTATTSGIEKMKELLSTSSPATPEAYRALGDKLNEENNMLLEKCTMKGSAHNNLHIYLQPLMGRIGELQEVTSTERGKELVAEIETHLKAYYNYFR